MKDVVFDPLLFHLCLDLLQGVPRCHYAMTDQRDPLICVLLKFFCVCFFLVHTSTLPSPYPSCQISRMYHCTQQRVQRAKSVLV